ncbi:histidine kinase [Streptosporangium lutulentum]
MLLSRGAAWILTACVGAPLLLIWLAATLRSYWYSPVNGTTMVAILGTVVATALLADVRRSRTEIKKVRADNLETLREQAAMAERAKIAREMHDIVAHSVSMIAVQAETAPTPSKGSTTGPSRSSPRSRSARARRSPRCAACSASSAPMSPPHRRPRHNRGWRCFPNSSNGTRASSTWMWSARPNRCRRPWTSRPTGSSRRR